MRNNYEIDKENGSAICFYVESIVVNKYFNGKIKIKL